MTAAPAFVTPRMMDLPRRSFTPSVATTEDVTRLVAAGAAVALGVSGGKDSAGAAYATATYLDSIGHRGPRLLVHSDLGRVEWQDSLPACQRLADALGMELAVVRRRQGDLMDRWLQRWRDNLRRYANLECVKVILPWSTPSMRFCTSELKVSIICRYLVERFAGGPIVSANGIRREESANRANAPVAKPQPALTSKTFGTSGMDWHPIVEWTKADVLDYLAARGHPLHEAYTKYGSSRVSCCFCILGSLGDLTASATCPDNHAIYREMVELEAASTFGFQDARWLADVAPHLLSSFLRARVAEAKRKAARRVAAEARGRLPVTFMLLQPQSWHPDVWTDITRMLTLNGAQSAAGREMHLCPMQFDLADRVIEQFSMAGETVFDPFAGLGTVPYRAVLKRRVGWGVELNPRYFLDSCAYLRAAAEQVAMPTLFSLDEVPAVEDAAGDEDSLPRELAGAAS